MILAIILLIIILISVSLYLIGGKTIDNSTPPLTKKYFAVVEKMLSGHPQSEIFIIKPNYLALGVKNYGGETIFTLTETPLNTVKITFEIKNNPPVPNFILRFEFNQTTCIYEPEIVFGSINDKIAKKYKELFK